MKLYVVGYNKDNVGGGFSFVSNLISSEGIELVSDPDDCDIYFIPSASMYVSRQDFVPEGKKVVLRIDNALKNSRNGNSGMLRMKRLAKMADLIIYQSKWAREYISPMLETKAKEVIIVNGGDDKIFNKNVGTLPHDNKKIYLYSRSSNNESKMWPVAHYEFERISQKNKDTQLWIMGRFSPQNQEYNFDFSNNEDWKYLGFPSEKAYVAMIYQSADYLLFPHWNEACPNTLLEWLLVKDSLDNVIFSSTGLSGGSIDIVEGYKKYGYDWLKKERMNKEYLEEFNVILQ